MLGLQPHSEWGRLSEWLDPTEDEFQLRADPIRVGTDGSWNRVDLLCATSQVEAQCVWISVDMDSALAGRRGSGNGLPKQLTADALSHMLRINPE